MSGSMKTVLMAAAVALVVAALVVAAAEAAAAAEENTVRKDGLTVRKCDFPFQWPPPTNGPSEAQICNPRIFCIDDTGNPNNPWYLLQSRTNLRGEAFNKNYQAYEAGFGESLLDDYWLGLWCLHRMTAPSNNELVVRLSDSGGVIGTAYYSSFSIGLPSSKYTLRVEGFDAQRSDIGDSMNQSNGMKFTAFDQDNDKNSNRNCAEKYKGGWWYNDCKINAVNNFLNGYFTLVNQRREKGVQWESWKTTKPVVSTLMIFRPQLISYGNRGLVVNSNLQQLGAALPTQNSNPQANAGQQQGTAALPTQNSYSQSNAGQQQGAALAAKTLNSQSYSQQQQAAALPTQYSYPQANAGQQQGATLAAQTLNSQSYSQQQQAAALPTQYSYLQANAGQQQGATLAAQTLNSQSYSQKQQAAALPTQYSYPQANAGQQQGAALAAQTLNSQSYSQKQQAAALPTQYTYPQANAGQQQGAALAAQTLNSQAYPQQQQGAALATLYSHQYSGQGDALPFESHLDFLNSDMELNDFFLFDGPEASSSTTAQGRFQQSKNLVAPSPLAGSAAAIAGNTKKQSTGINLSG